MVVERIGVHNRVLEGRRGAVLAPSVLGRDLDQGLERLAVLLVDGGVVGDREAEDEDEGPEPVGGRNRQRTHGQAEVLGRLAEHLLGLEHRLSGARNDRREPHVAVARMVRIGLRPRADEEDRQIGHAEHDLVDLLQLFGSERQRHQLPVRGLGAGDGGEAVLAVLPLRLDHLGRAVELDLGGPDAFAEAS